MKLECFKVEPTGLAGGLDMGRNGMKIIKLDFHKYSNTLIIYL